MRLTIVKTPLLDLVNDLGYLLVSVPQEIQNLSYDFSLVLSQWHIFFLFIA